VTNSNRISWSLAPRFALVGVMLAAGALGGCGEVRRSLGMEKRAPDEFAVVTRAPLSLPPDYSLRPPEPGAPRPQEQASTVAARAAVFGGTAPAGFVPAGQSALGGTQPQASPRDAVTAGSLASAGATEPAPRGRQGRQAAQQQRAAPTGAAQYGATPIQSNFLNRIGASQADPGIRQAVNEETSRMIEASGYLIDRILGLEVADGTRALGELDATGEAERLKRNAQQGLPPTAGDTPIITKKRTGLFSMF
jgi:hypothetical protein